MMSQTRTNFVYYINKNSNFFLKSSNKTRSAYSKISTTKSLSYNHGSCKQFGNTAIDQFEQTS